ncbi:MAG: TatD family hydrolase [Candidatus Methylarchaceae archaeon HK02M2]|nr:TatD family hydrolase [Candidatus Methylarchaceae archaeon HK02M2]
MSIKFIDAHMHLADSDFDKYIRHIIAFLKKANIILLSNSMDLNSSLKTLSLSESFRDKLLPFVGIHPWSIQEADLEEFETFLYREKDRICGIGEIGLDRKYVDNEEAYRKQKSLFKKLLELAEKFEKPVSIHSRGSQKEVIDTLSSFRIKGIMLHWYSGDLQQLSRAVDRGCYVSFGPTIIYSKRSKILAERTPLELILTETDGPVRYACFGGKPAQPAFLPSVVFALSFILKLSFEDTANLVRDNSSSYMNMQL